MSVVRALCMTLSGLFLLACAPCFAEDSFFSQHAEGWHWYESEPTQQSEQPVKTPSSASTNTMPASTQSDPLAQIQSINHEVSEAKAQAVLNPTPQNVARYIALQNAVTHNAANFGQVWQQVIWQNPNLNYSIAHPTNQIAKDAFLDTQRQNESVALKQIAGQYGLFFFFAGSCPYCHRFAPIVKDLQVHYGMNVIPVSLDGGGLPEYPSPQSDKGQAQAFHVTSWPALFLVNPEKRQVIPVTYGLIGEDELTHRIVTLVAGLNNRNNNNSGIQE